MVESTDTPIYRKKATLLKSYSQSRLRRATMGSTRKDYHHLHKATMGSTHKDCNRNILHRATTGSIHKDYHLIRIPSCR